MQLLANVGLVVLLVRLFGARAGHPAAVGALPVLRHLGPGRDLVGGRRQPAAPADRAVLGAGGARRVPAHPTGCGTLVQAVAWLAVRAGCSTRRPSWCSARSGIVSARATSPPVGSAPGWRRSWHALPARGPAAMSLSGLAYLVALREPGAELQSRRRHQHDARRRHLQPGAPGVRARAALAARCTGRRSTSSPSPTQGTSGQLASLAVIGLRAPRDPPQPAATACGPGGCRLFFLACDVVLVVGRQGLVRRRPDLASTSATRARWPRSPPSPSRCATMPIIGRPRGGRRGPVTARSSTIPRRVVAAVTVVAPSASCRRCSTSGTGRPTMSGKPYFTSLLGAITSADDPVPLVDDAVPSTIMWPLGYPENLLSHLLVHYADDTEFVDVSTDHLNVVDDQGHVVPAQVAGVRRALPGTAGGLRLCDRGRRRLTPTRRTGRLRRLVGPDRLSQLRHQPRSGHRGDAVRTAP